MRIIIITMVLVSAFMKAQDAQKSAQTAGSEFLKQENSDSQSITGNQTVTNTSYTKAPDVEETKLKQNTLTPPQEKSSINTTVLLVVFLLTAIAFYFIRSKIKTDSANIASLKLESEENDKLKKEIWKNLTKGNSDEETGEKAG